MRSLILAALLAGVAAPAFAMGQNQDNGGRRNGLIVRNAQRVETRTEERSEPSAERPRQPNFEGRPQTNRPESNDRVRSIELRRNAPLATAAERAERQGDREGLRQRREVQGEARVDQPPRDFEPRLVRAPGRDSATPIAGRTGGSAIRERRLRDRPANPAVVEPRTSRGATGATIEERNLRRAPGMREQPGSDLVQQRRSVPRVFEPANRRVSRTPAFGTEPPVPRTAASRIARPEHAWRTNWRNDHRYDWYDWRRRHRSNFHLGLYYDPYGWDYLRYGIGWRLWPNYYRSSFWLDDPWRYRLPPAYGPYRWVRYHYDAVLVNIYSGQVADIVYDFFW